jgi:uracil-DNA glycosylase family 4
MLKGHADSSRLPGLHRRIIACRKCPRLVAWRERVAREKVLRFRDQEYWGKPIPGFGDPEAELLLVGLAPAAHGGNRTGRMFTGDRSGDWLYRALWKAGFANQPTSISRKDGLELRNCSITAACRCAPPQNRLLPSEVLSCRPFLLEEISFLPKIRVIVGLGKVGSEAAVAAMRDLGAIDRPMRFRFSHGAEYPLNDRIILLSSFHPSQQNTFTGRLTEAMFDSVFRRAKEHLNVR